MKKRKELDALVTNGSRAKLAKKKNMLTTGKDEGHELLLNIESDTGSSLDLDYAPTKRIFVRKPHTCSICLSGSVLILLVASILLSLTLLWMNFDLKKDVDGLRKRLDIVENVSGTSRSQLDSTQALMNGLEKNINDSRNRLKENIQRLDSKLLQITLKISALNLSTLGMKTKLQQSLLPQQQSAADGPQLQMVVADLGSEVAELKDTVQDVQSSQKQHQEALQSLSKNVADMRVNETLMNLSTVLTTVTNMDLKVNPTIVAKPTQVVPIHSTFTPVTSQLESSRPTPDNGPVTAYFEQRLLLLSHNVATLNASLAAMHQQQGLFTQKLLLSEIADGGISADNSSSLVDIMQLQTDVQNLMTYAVSLNSTSGKEEHNILTIRAQIADLQLTDNTLAEKINQLNPHDLNNNLLNLNTTLGIQNIMNKAMQKIKEENLQDINNLVSLVNQVEAASDAQQQSIDSLKEEILNIHKVIKGMIATKMPDLETNTTSTDWKGIVSTSTEAYSLGNISVSQTLDMLPPSITAQSVPTPSITAQSVTTPTVGLNGTTTMNESTGSTPSISYLKMPSIEKLEDLQKRFPIWDMDHDGVIPFQDMVDFMGVYFVGTEQFEPFDLNQDSSFNETELISAFGLDAKAPSDDVHNRRRIGDMFETTTSG